MPFLSSAHPTLFFILSSSVALSPTPSTSHRGSPKEVEAKSHTTPPSCHSSLGLSLPALLKCPIRLILARVKFGRVSPSVPRCRSVCTDRVHGKAHALSVFFFAAMFPCGFSFTASRISIGRAICDGATAASRDM